MQWAPRVYQSHMHNFGVDVSRFNMLASPGTGKTSTGYALFDTLRMLGEANRMLVIAPKKVAKNVWAGERNKWLESFGHLKVAAAVGTPAQRLAAVRSNPDLLAINYDNLEWLIDGYGDNWPFDFVFADEAHKLKGLRITTTGSGNVKGQGSVRAKKLAHIAHRKVRRWCNATGSPVANGLVDAWGINWFIDGGRTLGSSFDAFEDRWFYTKRNPDGYTVRVPLPHAKAEIEALMRPHSITIDAKDYFPLKDVVERHVMVDLPPSARQAYDSMEEELFANIEEHLIHVFTAGSKSNKCLQIANGTVYHDKESNWTAVHDEKIDALASLIDELNGENVIVRYQYRSDLARIMKAFPRAKFLDDKPATEEAWNRGEIPMLVTHAASAGHGLSLQHGGRVLIDYSSFFNYDEDSQIIERIGPTRQYQSGYERSVYRYRIIARDTLEETAVLPCVLRKMTVQESFKEALKHR